METGTSLLIYGVPISEAHDKALGAILEANDTYPFIGIIYCGYKAGDSEVRIATDRLFYFPKSSVQSQGNVDGYTSERIQVRYYRLEVNAEVYEKHFKRLSLGHEIEKSFTFASAVAVPPQCGIDISQIDNLSREELQALVDEVILSKGSDRAHPRRKSSCDTWRQSYTETRYDPWSRSDPSGADCD